MKTTSQTKNKEFYYRIEFEQCHCGAEKEVLYKYLTIKNNPLILKELQGFVCHICGERKRPPKIELPKKVA